MLSGGRGGDPSCSGGLSRGWRQRPGLGLDTRPGPGLRPKSKQGAGVGLRKGFWRGPGRGGPEAGCCRGPGRFSAVGGVPVRGLKQGAGVGLRKGYKLSQEDPRC